MASHPLTIMFWPESAYGPTNQCIGLASILRGLGYTEATSGKTGGSRRRFLHDRACTLQRAHTSSGTG